MRHTVFFSLLTLTSSMASAYKLSRSYAGNDFIEKFNFWDDNKQKDPTGSDSQPSAALYVPQNVAKQKGLVSVNGKGNFVMTVDTKTTLSGNDLRPSVRISSKDPIQHGLLVLDAIHVPYGKGTWPAFWLSGANGQWPGSGEIDIYEGVGEGTQNTMSYHTSDGCSYDTSAAQSGSLTKQFGTNCDALQNGDQACGNVDPRKNSFGKPVNDAGGGVYAMEWTPQSVKMWFFERSKIPQDIHGDSPNPSSWGTPVTDLTSKSCNIDQHFGPQSIIFNLELCGTWEGSVFEGGPSACMDFVRKNPSAFKETYFEVASLKYFE